MNEQAASTVAVFGAGPAGLRAAEVIAGKGLDVTVYDRMPSAGRKFLVAGRGGLNLTHSEPFECFVKRYHGGGELRWRDLLSRFPPEMLRAWALGLGVETFVGTSGRVFPVQKQSAHLLRRWIENLRNMGVRFRMRHAFGGFTHGGIQILTSEGLVEQIHPTATVFALGGGSWPGTGSDGGWIRLFVEAGVAVRELMPANCGFEVQWPASVLEHEGKPLKNLAGSIRGETARGEAIITKYGLEGGLIYRLSRWLRDHQGSPFLLDLKPDQAHEQLMAKVRTASLSVRNIRRVWKLDAAAAALFAAFGDLRSLEMMARSVKALAIPIIGPRPLAEAISSAGGIKWDEIDESLMLRKIPGCFVAGEMIDWEAPTGGYLLQGCFATGSAAGAGAAAWATSVIR